MYDAIIIGLGSMGSSTLYQLAKQGVNVLGIEQFDITHDKGSHSGQTRIVRKAYFEHPDYVPLLEGAYKGWQTIREESGKRLFHKNGLVYFGEEDHPVMKGVKASSELHDIDLDNSISGAEYSMFHLPDSFKSIFEPNAGFALANETIRTYLFQAEKSGAHIKTEEEVKSWHTKDDTIEVITTKGSYTAQKLVITAGAYVNQVLPQLYNQHSVTRQLLSWVKPKDPGLFEYGKFPCWVIADQEYPGIFYGFPMLATNEFGGNGLLKVAHHAVGESIHPKDLDLYDPGIEKEKIINTLRKYIPDALGEIVSMSACLYTNTPDEHFIIDFFPKHSKQVIIATGFSGHGFKFVPVIGEILSDLVLKEETTWPIDFLGLKRFNQD